MCRRCSDSAAGGVYSGRLRCWGAADDHTATSGSQMRAMRVCGPGGALSDGIRSENGKTPLAAATRPQPAYATRSL